MQNAQGARINSVVEDRKAYNGFGIGMTRYALGAACCAPTQITFVTFYEPKIILMRLPWQNDHWHGI